MKKFKKRSPQQEAYYLNHLDWIFSDPLRYKRYVTEGDPIPPLIQLLNKFRSKRPEFARRKFLNALPSCPRRSSF